MIVRIFSAEELYEGQVLALTDKQCHYLANVLRLSVGAEFFMFDGKNGEFEVQIEQISHKKGLVKVCHKVKDFESSADIWLLFAPLKKDNTDIVIQKATELGVRRIQPVITDYTNSEKVRLDRFQAQSIEAAEQCRRTDVPEIMPAVLLKDLLRNWPADRVLFFLNEKGADGSFLDVLEKNKGKAAVLVGPEGGFSSAEAEFLLQHPLVRPVSLGPRILRAETAAVAALSCWQAINGDWQKGGK